MDDDRIGEEEPSAWIRLKKYLIENQLNIVEFRLRFRDNIVNIGKGTRGYYFAKGCGKDSTSIETSHFYIVGAIKDTNNFQCVWYKIPELVISDSYNKYVIDNGCEQCIIWNNYGKTENSKVNL
jgi:hypothetical protein